MNLAVGHASVLDEKNEFNWILHHDEPGANLLVLPFNEAVEPLPPGIIFASFDWKSAEFEVIQEKEMQRMPEAIRERCLFKTHKKGNRPFSAYDLCFDPGEGYLARPDLKYCFITPLEKGLHQDALVDDLVCTILNKNASYCTCGDDDRRNVDCRDENEWMILCDNVNCEVGWYHIECIEEREDHMEYIREGGEYKDWVCETCKRQNGNVRLTDYDNDRCYEKVFPESDERVQLARSVASALRDRSFDTDEVKAIFTKQSEELLEVTYTNIGHSLRENRKLSLYALRHLSKRARSLRHPT